MGLEPTNLLTASQALYQLSYAPSGSCHAISRRADLPAALTRDKPRASAPDRAATLPGHAP
jgi:hypothetical protein